MPQNIQPPRFLVLLATVFGLFGIVGLGITVAQTPSFPDTSWYWHWRQPPYQIYYSSGYPYILPYTNVVALDGNNPSTIYVANRNNALLPGMYLYPDGVYKSTDSGVNWQYRGHVDDYPESDSYEAPTIMLSRPITPALVFVGYQRSYYTAGIYRSTDSGSTWNSVLPYLGINNIALDPTNPQVMYASTVGSPAPPATTNGIYKSEDTGATWHFLSNQLLQGIAVHPITPTLLFGVSWYSTNPTEGLYRSADGGATWTQVTNFGGQGQVNLLIDNADPNRMYAYGRIYGEMYKTDDGGATWTITTQTLPSSPIEGNTHTIQSAALDPTDHNTIWIGVKYMGMFVSPDRGATWTESNDGIPFFGGSMFGPQCTSISLAANGHHAIACSGRVYVREPILSTPTPTPIPTSTPTSTPSLRRIFLPLIRR